MQLEPINQELASAFIRAYGWDYGHSKYVRETVAAIMSVGYSLVNVFRRERGLSSVLELTAKQAIDLELVLSEREDTLRILKRKIEEEFEIEAKQLNRALYVGPTPSHP